MAKPILLVVHQDASDPGRVARLLRQRGFALDLRRPCRGDPLPTTMEDHAAAVLFGGPMSANDVGCDFIRRELDWLPVVLAGQAPLLGICLGAQMIARVLGAEVRPHPEGRHEIGYFPIHATEAGQDLFPPRMMVYHWHGEGFDLPRSATLLAEGDTFRHQAFAYGERVYGLQFHPEVTPAIQHRWLTRGAERLMLPGAQERRAQIALRGLYDRGLREWLDRFLGHWLRPLSGEHAMPPP